MPKSKGKGKGGAVASKKDTKTSGSACNDLGNNKQSIKATSSGNLEIIRSDFHKKEKSQRNGKKRSRATSRKTDAESDLADLAEDVSSAKGASKRTRRSR